MEQQLRSELEKVLGEKPELEEIEEGINTIYTASIGKEEYILKVHTHKENSMSETYREDKKGRFRAEAEIYRHINEKTEIPSPEIIYSDFSEEIIDHQFYLMEKMEGDNLDRAKERLSLDQLEKLMRQYGEMLAEIHQKIRFNSYGLLKFQDSGIGYIEKRDTWRESFRKILENLVEMTRQRWENPPDLELEDIEPHIEKLPEDPEPVLVHSDNRLENILVKDGSISAFLDWSFTRSGHGEYDLARAEYFLIDYDLDHLETEKRERLRKSLLTGYRSKREICDFEQHRQLYRYSTVLWSIAGFPNWSAEWSEEKRERYRKDLLQRLEREKPE